MILNKHDFLNLRFGILCKSNNRIRICKYFLILSGHVTDQAVPCDRVQIDPQ